MNATVRLRAFFRANRRKWIDGEELARIAGRYAWRTRTSECRRFFRMRIENRIRWVKRGERRWKVSEYRWATKS